MFDFFKKINQLPDIYTIQLEPDDIVIDCGANIGKVTEKLKNKFINKLNVNCYHKGVWINSCEKKIIFS